MKWYWSPNSPKEFRHYVEDILSHDVASDSQEAAVHGMTEMAEVGGVLFHEMVNAVHLFVFDVNRFDLMSRVTQIHGSIFSPSQVS